MVGTTLAAAAAGAVDVGIAVLATAAGVPVIPQLGVPGVAAVSVVGSAIAVVGWALVRSRAADPRPVLRRLVPAVLLLSFLPDLLLGLMIGPTVGWAPVAVLGSMHVTTAAVVLAGCGRALPVGHRTAA